MAYKIYRFEFTTGVHFGKNDLTESNYTFGADTLFSALCIEAIRHGQQYLDKLVTYVKGGDLLLSDAFPYIGETYYVPKPFVRIQNGLEEANSVVKKAIKKLKYIPLDKIELFLNGKLDAQKEGKKLGNLGQFYLKTQAYLQENAEALPYHVGTYYYNQGNGLYVLVKYTNEDVREMLEELLTEVECVGIGGERSSGLGKFCLKMRDLPEGMEKHFEHECNTYMALSLCLPTDEEMELALQDASYSIACKSGFVASETYADVPRKKNNLYVCEAGSCFKVRFLGDVYDVSDGGNHPVYRYAKAFLLGVEG